MRPYTAYGEVRTALGKAAEDGPGSVRELAVRAQVGYAAAKYTASRMLDRDELVVWQSGKPAKLALPNCPAIAPAGETLAAALQKLQQSFWERPAPQASRHTMVICFLLRWRG